MDIKIGCEVVLRRQNKILLGKRKNSYGEGTWALPGGHLEAGEKLIECAKRELFEVLDIHDPSLRLVCITDDIRKGDHYVHVTFELDASNIEIRLKEPHKCYEWRYFDLNDFPKEIFNPHEGILSNYLSQSIYNY